VTGSRAPRTRRSPGLPPSTGGRNDGWTAVSYLLGGMIVYGGIGWLLGHWVFHSALFFPLGMVVGLALSTVLVIFRFGRS
jgi:F0F1-type ATP synthase assembly protein I